MPQNQVNEESLIELVRELRLAQQDVETILTNLEPILVEKSFSDLTDFATLVKSLSEAQTILKTLNGKLDSLQSLARSNPPSQISDIFDLFGNETRTRRGSSVSV